MDLLGDRWYAMPPSSHLLPAFFFFTFQASFEMVRYGVANAICSDFVVLIIIIAVAVGLGVHFANQN